MRNLSTFSLSSLTLLCALFFSCKNTPKQETPTTSPKVEVTAIDSNKIVHFADEKHLANVQQLSNGGENAEAYFSYDNKRLIYQLTDKNHNLPCDQIFMANLPTQPSDTLHKKLISTGTGRTTCSFFYPTNDKVIFASTHLSNKDCPPVPDREKIKKYVWPIYDSYEIFLSDTTGKILKQFTNNKFYDAEATVSPDGSLVVFTSNRSGDLELYTMKLDGSNVKQVTKGLGYDGGAFFSPDSKKLVFRASRPQSPEDVKEYKDLLAQGLVAPTNMEIYTCNVDGSDLQQITKLGQANWAPYFHPSGQKIIFSSNHEAKRGFPFNLYMINIDGTGLERITHDKTFNAFPMFSYDGKKIVFSSNRNNGGGHDTNIFIADWID